MRRDPPGGASLMDMTRIDLPKTVRKQSASLLQAHLADAIDLFTQAKQAHWNVKGPSFIALHELFDKVAEIVEAHGDLIAERITALGDRADGTVRFVSSCSRIEEYPTNIVNGRDHVDAVASRLAQFGRTVRSAIGRADALGDAGTS